MLIKLHSFFLTFTLFPTFLLLFTFSSPQKFYLDITLPLSFYLPLICFFSLSSSLYKFVIYSSILYIIFSHKKVVISHSFSLNFLAVFYFYFSCISILAWKSFVLFRTLFWLMGFSFVFLSFIFYFFLFFMTLIVKYYHTAL